LLHLAIVRSNAPVIRGLLAAGVDLDVKSGMRLAGLELSFFVLASFSVTF